MIPSIQDRNRAGGQIISRPTPSLGMVNTTIDPISRTVTAIGRDSMENLASIYEENIVLPPNSALRQHLGREYISKGFKYQHVPNNGICEAVSVIISHMHSQNGKDPVDSIYVKTCAISYLATQMNISQKEIVEKLIELWNFFKKEAIFWERDRKTLRPTNFYNEIIENLPEAIGQNFKHYAVKYFKANKTKKEDVYEDFPASDPDGIAKSEWVKKLVEICLEMELKNIALKEYGKAVIFDEPEGDRFALWALWKSWNLPISEWIEKEGSFYSIDYGPIDRDELKTIHLIQHQDSFTVLLPPPHKI